MEGQVVLQTNENTLVATLSQGDFFGEVALLSSRKSSTSAQVTEDAQILEIPEEEVSVLLLKNQELAFRLDEIIDSRRKKIISK